MHEGCTVTGQPFSLITITDFFFLQILLVLGILTSSGGPEFAAVALSTLTVYVVFTVLYSQYRARVRQRMVRLETKSSAKAFDSLINVETVQAFGNADLETEQFGKILVEQHDASHETSTSLAILNFGQNLIFSAGLTAVMVMAGQQILQGTMVRKPGVHVPLGYVGRVSRRTCTC